MLTFGTSVAINNLLALKAFHTFLFNYQMHYHPSWLERRFIPRLRSWVEKRAILTMAELVLSMDAKSASVSLNDVSAGLFGVLYLVQNSHELIEIKTGQELFMLLAQMELEFVKMQKVKQPIEYKPNMGS
jgi:hypothetical protein